MAQESLHLPRSPHPSSSAAGAQNSVRITVNEPWPEDVFTGQQPPPQGGGLDKSMADDIDALAAASYEGGKDVIDVAVERITVLIEVRDTVIEHRRTTPQGSPTFGPTDPSVIGRRLVAALLDAGWRPPTDDEVKEASRRSKEATERFDEWRRTLSPEQWDRGVDHYSSHGEWPPDLQPPP